MVIQSTTQVTPTVRTLANTVLAIRVRIMIPVGHRSYDDRSCDDDGLGYTRGRLMISLRPNAGSSVSLLVAEVSQRMRP